MFKKQIDEKNPVAYFMYGPPGCGKSSFISENFEGFTNVSLDTEREPLYAAGKNCHTDKAAKNIVWENTKRNLKTAIDSREPIIIDNTNIFTPVRDQFFRPLVEAGYAIVFIYFDVNLDTCLKRNAEREGWRRVPDDAVISMFSAKVDPAVLLVLPRVVGVYVINEKGDISRTLTAGSLHSDTEVDFTLEENV